MAWIYLLLAGICEIAWAVGLKHTHGFSRLWPTVWTVIIMLLSFVLLALAMRNLPLGTSYAVWTGIGAVGTTIYGIIQFGESREPLRLLCLVLIVLGIVGLKLLSEPAR